ncbi:outer membrane protein assembly factor BamE [Candidatus Vallotia cooleyia]|uniref:outer membrane protein assembly factor BamE n=1 Tax=Candidatus Vallotiella adelgis TaxID=1177211 RepID=UPI001D035B85|nr:outer membrane protein assembly factor BamE [Candidatus Vallotia cooleyia]UDG82183.1 Outer membrane protein assembly factor BamE [Candidatus Vallotia cooleyia]
MRRTFFLVITRFVILAAVASLSACTTYDGWMKRVVRSITPYQIVAMQGNFVSAEAASRLRIGMSRDEVRSVLGTPLLAGIFHADRWDYMFYFKRGLTAIVQPQDLVVHFAGQHVVSWTGAECLPSEQQLIAAIDGGHCVYLKKAPSKADFADALSSKATSNMLIAQELKHSIVVTSNISNTNPSY